MQNLRIVNVSVVDSSNIDVTFTEVLTPNLVTANVSIIADTLNVPDAQVLQIKVSSNVLSIVCQPMTPLAAYFLQLQSVSLHPFTSLNGDVKVSEDGVSNKFLITAPLSPDNPVQNYLGAFFRDNVYNLDDSNAVVSKYIQSLAVTMARALYDIRQLKNENYLSTTIIDEQKIRGGGPFDRLNEEGAYEIIRLGRGASTANANNSFQFDIFPSYPITLQRNSTIETLHPDSTDTDGKFNINSLTFNLSNFPVTRVNSIIFTLNTANPVYVYNISQLGYQIKDSRYDQDFGFSYLPLATNQIKISEQILSDPNFSLDNILKVDVQYEYKNLGVVINDPTTITVTTVLDATREVLPPIINVFSLQHAPIVDSSNNVPLLGGLVLTDPNNNLPGGQHPAFLHEIPFRLSSLPVTPGQYAVDYNAGQVYVYGADLNNDGTGPTPPLATYKYRLTYKSEQDYVFDPDSLDLVALPPGNLVNNSGLVFFNFEEVFVPGVDYTSALHQEILQERVENRLLALNVIRTKQGPITNVFRILNETSGEIYTLNRWDNDKIYFRFNNPPRVIQQTGERASFNTVPNELLFVNTTVTNVHSLKIFKIFLHHNVGIAATEDSVASSFNTSMVFSNGNVFKKEKWFNRTFAASVNIDRLSNVGEYEVDYANGVVYVAVSNSQGFDLGTVTYKNDSIIPQFPHLISVDDIYYRFSSLVPKNRKFSFTSFDDGTILPETLDASDELFLNNNSSAPYQLLNGAVGIFFNSSFIAGVTNQVKSIRSIYEYNDLLNSTNPLNFAFSSTANNFNINVAPISKQVFENVQFDGSNFYVTVNENIPYLSPDITYTFSVTRVSDGKSLWNGTGTIVPGDPVKLILPGINSPVNGDLVNVQYTFVINNISRIVVDYNKGDYFVDYTYVADEIIISYEYGDNVIDFRNSLTVPANTQYFVSYKAGALRDALLKNFGTLVNVPELSNFDIDFNRERYRDALMAALSSFIQGPTIGAIKNIGQTISHIEPEVIESAFINWSLGSSLLFPEPISTTGTFDLLTAKFGKGVLVKEPDQTIKFPVNANIRLEEGTFENWIIPQWNGLDNDANLTFSITRDGYAIAPNRIFIGASEHHPAITNGKFSLNKHTSVTGTPNTNKDGVFIYYDNDMSGNFQRWFVRIIDGYVAPNSPGYKFEITSNGKIYDNKSMLLPKPSNLTIFTGVSSIKFSITAGGAIDEGITFLADLEHYVLDFGEDISRSRLSIFKDVSGYMNFRVYDKDKQAYSVSADVSAWKIGQPHHVAASWKLNTRNNRDEMHLFLDGFEVPNIIKYGQKLRPFLHEKFRTVDPEEIVGLVNRDIVGSVDLQTIAGSTSVTSSLNFSSFNISIGDIIIIDELGFSPTGYTIININGQTLGLSASMPRTLTNGRFSINRTQFPVTSDIDVSPNIAVTTIHTFLTGTDAVGTMGTNTIFSASTNFSTQGVQPGYLVRVDNTSLSTTYTVLQVLGHTLVIDDKLAVNFSTTNFQVYSRTENEIPGARALRPSYSISKDVNFHNILTISNNVKAGDLILIRTLGINHRRVRKQAYVWSNEQENVLMTMLPPPISLDETKITKIIMPVTSIGTTNSTLIGGVFVSNNLAASPPSNAQNGRTISATISGNNVDFSTPVTVTINGVSGINTISETIVFTDYGTLDFANPYLSINYIQVNAKPINANKSAVNVEVREKYVITHSEFSGLVPVIRYSYWIGGGFNLQKDGYSSVRDEHNLFSGLDTNNILLINSPASVAGFYTINGFSADRKTLFISSTNTAEPQPLPPFTNGLYQILNVNAARSGLQNGFFTFEVSKLPSQAYFLHQGFYELEYVTYDRIKFDALDDRAYLGSDFHGTNQLNGIIDQVKIYSVMLTDTRIGESIPNNQRSITKDFNSLKPLKSDPNTLMLIDFDNFPFSNTAGFYSNTNRDKQHFQSAAVVNENFGNSVVILDKPIIVENTGILNTRMQGTIEFWLSPLFDTANDPNDRFYFDGFGAVIEEAVSVNSTAVKLSAPASQILSVKLKAGDPRIDYFVGGKIEIDTQHARQDEGLSIGDNSVIVPHPILQVITVKIIGDPVEKDYFAGGSVGSDGKTIFLGTLLPANSLPLIITYQTTENKNVTLNTQVIRLNRKLPNQNSHVVVNYIPKGLQGDRISIFKDRFGYMNFGILASGIDYVVRAPVFWTRNTWHRVKASYKINGGMGSDEMRLFLDGYEFSDVTFGSEIIFGKFPIVMGASAPGGGVPMDGYGLTENIKFRDPINELFIGTDYTGANPVFSLMDNFRISDISRPIYAPYGESLDVNYSTNLDTVFPVTEDLFTTYLVNFNEAFSLNTDFAILKNRSTGLFDFSVNILDSFGIVSSNIKSKEALEELINILKPANSRVFIQYIR
jgi:hypothetical protein